MSDNTEWESTLQEALDGLQTFVNFSGEQINAEAIGRAEQALTSHHSARPAAVRAH